MEKQVWLGSENVFRDIGFPPGEAENLKVRADLMLALERLLKRQGLTQARAAKLLGVSQPRISDLVRGRSERFSIDTLVAMLGRAGAAVSITIGPQRKMVRLR